MIPVRLSPRPLRAMRRTKLAGQLATWTFFVTFAAMFVPLLTWLDTLDPAGLVR